MINISKLKALGLYLIAGCVLSVWWYFESPHDDLEVGGSIVFDSIEYGFVWLPFILIVSVFFSLAFYSFYCSICTKLFVEKMTKTSELMSIAVEDAEITDYEYLIPQLELPDENDRHVLAAAIVGHADAIVTLNMKDFPQEIVSKHHIEILHPDDFLCNQLDLYRLQVLAQVKAARMALKNPTLTAEQIINSYRRSGLFQFSEALQEALPLI